MATVRNGGHVQLRRGLMEHVQNRSMTIGEFFLYVAILSNADPETGVWISSAGMLSSYFGIPQRTCKDQLAKLEKKLYITRFMVQGRHTQYPILIHKFQCTAGARKGLRLNALKSTSYQDLRYEACPDPRPDGAPAGALTVPQSTREGEKERKKTTTKAAPSSFQLPNWVPLKTWNGWIDVRKKKRAANTEHALDLAVRELDKLRAAGYSPTEVLEQSILKSYTGLFPVKTSGASNSFTAPVKHQSNYEVARVQQREERQLAIRLVGKR